MVKTDTILMVAAVVAGGYLIYKSNIAEGIGDIAEGAGTAAQGLGGGISTAAQGLGQGVSDISGQLASVTGDVAELTAFVGEFGSFVQQEISELKGRSLREYNQETEVDKAAFVQTKEPLTTIQADIDIKKAEEAAKRAGLIAEEKTQYVGYATNIDSYVKKTGSFLWAYNPLSVLTNWVSSQSSVDSEAAPQVSQTSGPTLKASTGSDGVVYTQTSGGSSGGPGSSSSSGSDLISRAFVVAEQHQAANPLGAPVLTPQEQSAANEPSTFTSTIKKYTSWVSPWW